MDQRRFSRPRNLGELCQRLVRNVEYYQSNYVFVFLGLILYCVATSPMLLVALAVFFGACYILYLRTLQSKFVLFGEKSLAQTVHILVSWNANLLTPNPSPFESMSAQASIYTRFPQTRSLKVSDTPDAPTHSQRPQVAIPQV